jgi:hypothetical protein
LANVRIIPDASCLNRNKKIAVATSDFRCPECGSPLEPVGRKKTTLYTLYVLIGVLAVLLLALGPYLISSKPHIPGHKSATELPTFFPPRATDSLTAIFQNGSLSRAEAANLLQTLTGASRATCYRALDLNGPFSERLKDETGMLAWRN